MLINKKYLNTNEVRMKKLSRVPSWLFKVTHNALTDAPEFVKAV